ncbi:MAG TPA: DNA polymerase III subunit delta, partial [Vicinamibacteria bacterium]|nr:DNA polymerase III subunit delta [Vicinamibacteria bacterium]
MIAGADSFLADEALRETLAARGGQEADSVESFRGEETTWARVLDLCRTGSLFAPQRAVVIRNAEALKGGEEGEVEAYLDAPNPGVTLVLVAAKPDRRRTLWKVLLARAGVISAEPPKGRALRGYVTDLVRKRRLAVSDEGFEEILERVGGDLRRLVGEVDKLEAFAGGKRLSAEDVASVLGRGAAPPLYRLADAFAARRATEVLDLLERLLAEGEPPLKILGTLHRSLRQVRGAAALRAARAPREVFASKLGVPPFKVGDLIEASKGWSEGQLKRALGALGAADRRLKTSGEPRVTLSVATLEACAPDHPSSRGGAG